MSEGRAGVRCGESWLVVGLLKWESWRRSCLRPEVIRVLGRKPVIAVPRWEFANGDRYIPFATFGNFIEGVEVTSGISFP